MDEQHQLLYDAILENRRMIQQQININAACKTDRTKLRYYIYGLTIVILIILGKPEWIAAIL